MCVQRQDVFKLIFESIIVNCSSQFPTFLFVLTTPREAKRAVYTLMGNTVS